MKKEFKYEDHGYLHGKTLVDGQRAALAPFIFTTGLVVGIEDNGNYKYRFCYPDFPSALDAINNWEGDNDPPGPWIKEKGNRGERSNPVEFKGIPVAVEQKPLKPKV